MKGPVSSGALKYSHNSREEATRSYLNNTMDSYRTTKRVTQNRKGSDQKIKAKDTGYHGRERRYHEGFKKKKRKKEGNTSRLYRNGNLPRSSQNLKNKT